MTKRLTLFLLLACVLFSGCAQSPETTLCYNQIGYYPDASKYVAVTGGNADRFYVLNEKKDTVLKGRLTQPLSYSYSPLPVRLADISSITVSGNYVVGVNAVNATATITVQPSVHKRVATASLKAFYFQRASTALPEKYAGQWHRVAGHPDTNVMVHPSAASASRPTGTIIASPRGWYDAGDYNKYIVNSGITMGTLLSLYEDYPAYCKSISINIPESENNLPDLLDEILWNLRWMLTMQDPSDGGVYHKLTTASFEGMVMPDKATRQRYVVAKSTPAALDFAAVMAQAARILKAHNGDLPGLADSCLAAAKQAWIWAGQNPNVLYSQRELNPKFDPDITTGEYGDRDVRDEKIWAACELYVTTHDAMYLAAPVFPDDAMPLPSWGNVRLLGYYSLLRNKPTLPKDAAAITDDAAERLTKLARDWSSHAAASPFRTTMGLRALDFVWGSNAVAANQGILLLQAYKLTHDKTLLDAALSNLDYLLGRNATGFSFVTGFGNKTPMHPHHRPSVADGIEAPVPGLLSGGPNPGRQDGCAGYPSGIPNEAFVDNDCSYASNEIAINWNAPLVYLLWAIEAEMEH